MADAPESGVFFPATLHVVYALLYLGQIDFTKPLTHSLNPKAAAKRLRSVPQLHLSGWRDRLVPVRVLDSWLAELQPLPPCWVRRVTASEAGHQGPWLQAWRQAYASFAEQNRASYAHGVRVGTLRPYEESTMDLSGSRRTQTTLLTLP